MIHFECTLRAFAGLFEGRLEKFFVDVNPMEVVVILFLSNLSAKQYCGIWKEGIQFQTSTCSLLIRTRFSPLQ